MSLLVLPPEIRLQILTYLPSFTTSRPETIGPGIRITPSISRVSHTLRKESLPLYAATGTFVIQTDDTAYSPGPGGARTRALFGRLGIWLDALGSYGGEALAEVGCLQLSRHWRVGRPVRGEGHVGFYVRLVRGNESGNGNGSGWKCTVGTYPIANDIRGMRLESVELLRRVVEKGLGWSRVDRETEAGTSTTEGVSERTKGVQRNGDEIGKAGGLRREDVEFVLRAMEIVAEKPISSLDTDLTEGGRRRRRERWEEMESALLELGRVDGRIEEVGIERDSGKFYTPY